MKITRDTHTPVHNTSVCIRNTHYRPVRRHPLYRGSLRNKVVNVAAAVSVVLFAAMPTYANAHHLNSAHSQYDSNQFNHGYQPCSAMLNSVNPNEGVGAVEQGVKLGARGV